MAEHGLRIKGSLQHMSHIPSRKSDACAAGANCKAWLRRGSRDGKSAAWVTECAVICKDESSPSKTRYVGSFVPVPCHTHLYFRDGQPVSSY